MLEIDRYSQFSFEELVVSNLFTTRESNGYVYLDSNVYMNLMVHIEIPSAKDISKLELFLTSKYRFGNINGTFELNLYWASTKIKKQTISKLNEFLPEKCDCVMYSFDYQIYRNTPSTRGLKSITDFPIFFDGIDMNRYETFLISGVSIFQYFSFIWNFQDFQIKTIRKTFWEFMCEYYQKSFNIDLNIYVNEYSSIFNREIFLPRGCLGNEIYGMLQDYGIGDVITKPTTTNLTHQPPDVSYTKISMHIQYELMKSEFFEYFNMFMGSTVKNYIAKRVIQGIWDER